MNQSNPQKIIRAALILFFIGATLGTWMDTFHSHSGTLSYARPVLWQEAWWVPLLFGAAAVAGGLGQIFFAQARGWTFPERSWNTVLAGLTCFGVQYYLSGYWNPDPSLKIAAQALMAAGIWLCFSRRASGLVLCVIAAVLGTAVESTLTKFGLFSYARPDFARVPYWLPFLYVSFSVVTVNLGFKLLAANPGRKEF